VEKKGYSCPLQCIVIESVGNDLLGLIIDRSAAAEIVTCIISRIV
jgi:hypothetical protein